MRWILRNRILLGAVAVVLILTAVLIAVLVGGGSDDVKIRINEGDGASAIADTLKTAGIIDNASAFKIYARISGEHVYQMGVHYLNSDMSYREIIAELEKIPEAETVTVLIPEGFELRQIADTLEDAGLINRDVFMREVQIGSFDFDFIDKIPSRDNRLEGYLFPDTYKFAKDESEHNIINEMLANFNEKAVSAYNAAETDKTLDEIINLASIVEREAAGDDERTRVASVFVNRLNKNMKLESCATVQYLLKERKSILSNADTQIDSPYNTYKNNGLPPGPIASPGLKSIEAVLHPEQTNYLYFLATADGSHSLFAETFEQHLENQKITQGN